MKWPFRKRQPSADVTRDIESAIAQMCDSPSGANREALYRTLQTGSLLLATGDPPGGWPGAETIIAEKTVMPVVTTTAPSGRPAIMAFTSLDHLKRRSPQATGYTQMTTVG